jgi:hypothetical protein
VIRGEIIVEPPSIIIKYESYIEDESADIIEDIFIDPKNPVITIEDESVDIIEDESIDPKNPVITIEDESVDIIEDESIDPKNPVITIEDKSAEEINPIIIIDYKSTDPEVRPVVLY